MIPAAVNPEPDGGTRRVIELLGVGVPRPGGGWLLHRVCARSRPGEFTLVVARDPDEREALFEVLTARLIPEEGRLWVDGVPLMRETTGRVRARVGDARLDARLAESRTVLWNALSVRPSYPRLVQGLLRYPYPPERAAALRALGLVGLGHRAGERVASLDDAGRASFAVARGLVGRPSYLVVRGLDRAPPDEALRVLTLARDVARAEHIGVLAGVTDPGPARNLADRVLVLANGQRVFDGHPDGVTDRALGLRPA
jgi:ABC-type phosphate/phosphonate transport system ATPase subunit